MHQIMEKLIAQAENIDSAEARKENAPTKATKTMRAPRAASSRAMAKLG